MVLDQMDAAKRRLEGIPRDRLTAGDLQRVLGVKRRHFTHLRDRHCLPAGEQGKGGPRWRKAMVRDWINNFCPYANRPDGAPAVAEIWAPAHAAFAWTMANPNQLNQADRKDTPR